ncbi:MAG: fatty acid desaturase family protein [Bacteroidia bacterium]|nr:fatty acid desaturase family protein [Bacteroidia bacterium]
MSAHSVKDLNLNIDKAQLKPLYEMNPLRHALDMALNWMLILGTIFLTATYFNPFLYVLSVIIIGARMHALAILMHDASHFRFLPNRKWNDMVTNLVTLYPIFTTIEAYRQNHLRHHNHLNTEHDPDWVAKLGKRAFTFPKTKAEFVLRVLSYFGMVEGAKDAFWFFKRFVLDAPKPKKKKKSVNGIVRIAYYISLIIVLSVLGIWKEYLMYWIIPYLSTFFMFQYIRSVAEHFGELGYEHALNSTRTVKTNLIERFFLAPHNVGYHLEHHLYPGVPYYNLHKLHKVLMESEGYAEKAHITEGYLSGLMNELGKAQLGAKVQ